MSSPG